MSVEIEALPIKVVPVELEAAVPLPCKYRLVNDAEDPLNAMVIAAVVDVALADTTRTKSVYVPGIEEKSILAAPPAPTVAEAIRV